MTAKRGLFWYVDGKLLCFPVPSEEADTVSNNHRRFWETFHAGDIVCSHRKPGEPFVLTDLCTWDAETLRRELPISEYSNKWLSNLDCVLAKMRVRGDTSDMTCRGYTVSGDPGEPIPFVFNDDFFICDYLDLEYYRGPLKGIHKLLRPISDFLKGDRSIEFLLNTYWLAQQQAMLENSVAWFRSCYSKEALADIGILPRAEPPREEP